MKITGLIYGGKESYPDNQARLMVQYLSTLKDGTSITKEVKVNRGYKTEKQLAAYFGVLISKAIEQANDMGLDTSGFLKMLVREDLPSGVPLTKDTLYHLLLSLCPVYDEEHKKLSLSKMSTADAAKFFELCQNLLSSRGLDIPSPDPNWKG